MMTITKPKVKFERTPDNRVIVKVNLGNDGHSYTYRHGMGRSIRRNQGEDRKEYPFIVTFPVLDDFLYLNDVKEEDVEIDPNSIDEFYGFEDGYSYQVFASLAKSKVDNWWNHDCPDLYRHIVNKHDSTNMLGMKLITFSHKLVEAGWSYVYIGEDIREDEVEKLTYDYKDTRIYKEMKATLEARKISEDDIVRMKNYVQSYDDKIQNFIEEHQLQIVKETAFEHLLTLVRSDKYFQYFLSEFNINIEQDEDIVKEFLLSRDDFDTYSKIIVILDGAFGLDCGWVNIFTKDEDYNEYKKLLKNIPQTGHYTDYTAIKVPVEVQSTTLKRTQFDIIQRLVLNKLGEALYAYTQLD